MKQIVSTLLRAALAIVRKEDTVAKKKTARRQRPSWVTDAQRVSSGSLLVISRTDGTTAGFRVPKSSLREQAKSGGRSEEMAITGQ